MYFCISVQVTNNLLFLHRNSLHDYDETMKGSLFLHPVNTSISLFSFFFFFLCLSLFVYI